MRKFFLLCAIFFLTVSPAGFVFGMSSTNYKIDWDSLNTGGKDSSTSETYGVKDTMGEMGVGRSSSLNYKLRAGYREGLEAGSILFTLKAQSNASQVTYSAFSNAGKTVTVSSVTGYAAEDYIVVVENEGGSQMIAIGKITSVADPVITVDAWAGDNGSMSATPAGGNDYVYELTGSTVSLGTLSTSTVETGVTLVEVSTNAPAGYSVTVTEDGNLRDGANDIDDVGDSAVTIGSEEYGIETVGTYAEGSGDQAISGTDLEVASHTTFITASRTGIIQKAAIHTGTTAGSYSHILTYIVTATF